MLDLGPHAAFIWISYGAAAFCIVALALWAWGDERGQAKRLADLERRGLKRRSGQGQGNS
ncbi:heme exporter protein CcmD [Rhodomicrobium vannielii ATCC 17100]|uniref:Heme exporter protein D n=1 Tax=Rhodomicrobium vannielii (strain ATCC 17100 / DSM 162 / LMG 4299 / NCIMB 10020 / ATH 3.1.1) TaxID=648757 RepID=E3I4A6_RHOVT|nr:heme exporter protein CcmD [Rhodomicrobium vannielii]ADP70421.1 heme exporter protein CcmD [Rhodomicrobium vannielii ATCC 17100]